jgi:hypothetical protein
MSHHRNPEQRLPANDTAETFELVGDPNGLPESFFDALAGLLLEIAEAQKPLDDTEQGSRSADANK